MARIAFLDKVPVNFPALPDINLGKAVDFNEIKASVNVAYDAIELSRVAWVGGALGNDSSGVVGQQYKPYATVNAAIAAINAIAGVDPYVVRIAPNVTGAVSVNSGGRTIILDASSLLGAVTVTGGTVILRTPAGMGALVAQDGSVTVAGTCGNITAGPTASVKVTGDCGSITSSSAGTISIGGNCGAINMSGASLLTVNGSPSDAITQTNGIVVINGNVTYPVSGSGGAIIINGSSSGEITSTGLLVHVPGTLVASTVSLTGATMIAGTGSVGVLNLASGSLFYGRSNSINTPQSSVAVGSATVNGSTLVCGDVSALIVTGESSVGVSGNVLTASINGRSTVNIGQVWQSLSIGTAGVATVKAGLMGASVAATGTSLIMHLLETFGSAGAITNTYTTHTHKGDVIGSVSSSYGDFIAMGSVIGGVYTLGAKCKVLGSIVAEGALSVVSDAGGELLISGGGMIVTAQATNASLTIVGAALTNLDVSPDGSSVYLHNCSVSGDIATSSAGTSTATIANCALLPTGSISVNLTTTLSAPIE